MLRSFVAVFLLHFLVCVGISAVSASKPYFLAEPQQLVASAPQLPGHDKPGATSDADDHALLDDRQDFPDLLQPRVLAAVTATEAVPLAPLVSLRRASQAVAPPHKPPKGPGILA